MKKEVNLQLIISTEELDFMECTVRRRDMIKRKDPVWLKAFGFYNDNHDQRSWMDPYIEHHYFPVYRFCRFIHATSNNKNLN